MKVWSQFYPDVLPDLPMAPLPLLDHWLRNTAIEFAERSKAIRVDLTAMDAVADQMPYTITLAANTDLVEVVAVKFSGDALTPKSVEYLESKYAEWETETGTPEHYTQQAFDTLLLVPAPSAAATAAIKIKAATKPGAAATGIDDWVFAKWRQVLVAGVKAKMMAMPDKPWANPERVAFHLSIFEDAIAKAETDANSGFVRSRPRFSGSFC